MAHSRPVRRKITPALSRAVKAAPWITDADAAAVAVATRWAQEIDAQGSDPEAVRVVGWVGTNLTSLLRSLALTPEARIQLGVGATDEGPDPLAELRGELAALTSQHPGQPV